MIRITYPSQTKAAHIQTDRLSLRPCKWSDLPALHRLWTDPQVRKYLWDDIRIPRKTAAKVVQRSIADFRSHAFGIWAVFLRDHEGLIGFCGFRCIENSNDVEILYGFFPSFWKKGYATEAARGVLGYGFEHCCFERIFGRTDVPNLASVKLLERLGMTFIARERVYNLETFVYSITRTEFECIANERTRLD